MYQFVQVSDTDPGLMRGEICLILKEGENNYLLLNDSPLRKTGDHPKVWVPKANCTILPRDLEGWPKNILMPAWYAYNTDEGWSFKVDWCGNTYYSGHGKDYNDASRRAQQDKTTMMNNFLSFYEQDGLIRLYVAYVLGRVEGYVAEITKIAEERHSAS
jgi:hypothetical protein